MLPLHSEHINEIVKALAAANAGISHALMDSTNPHFNNDFASLEAVIDATKAKYAENGLVVIQQPSLAEDGKVILITTFAHTSGQWFKSYTPVLSANANDPQKMGSGISYARRYALAAMANIGQADDDGIGAAGNEKKPKGAIEDDPRSKAIAELVAKFRKLQVSEGMICTKYGLKSAAELEDEMIADLNRIGTAIVTKKEKVESFFKPQPGAKK